MTAYRDTEKAGPWDADAPPCMRHYPDGNMAALATAHGQWAIWDSHPMARQTLAAGFAPGKERASADAALAERGLLSEVER